MPTRHVEDPPRLAKRPMRVVRPADLEDYYANPRAVLRDRAAKGQLHKVAYGTYVVVPDDAYDQHRWRPALEDAAGAIATAIYGDRTVALMGMTAARLHGAVPRALGRATVAVPRRHRDVALSDRRDAVVEFVRRDLNAVDTQPVKTELGVVLVTTPEQTLLDLARDRTANPADRRAAMLALGGAADWNRVEELAARQRGGAAALPVLRRIRQELGR